MLSDYYEKQFGGQLTQPFTSIIPQNIFRQEAIRDVIKGCNFKKGHGPNLFSGLILQENADLSDKVA